MKNILILFSLSILLVSASNCGSSRGSSAIQLEGNPPFVISEIYAQDWMAGVEEGGSGTNVHITFETLNKNLSIESVYFANKIFLVRQEENNPKVFLGSYKAVSGRNIIMDTNPIKEAKNTPFQALPFELKNHEAVIKYSVDGTVGFFKISNVLLKPKIAYPAAKRN